MPFLRFLFTTKGVGLKRAIQGQLLCEKCHSTLRIRSIGFRFWIVTIFFILLFVVEALAVNQLVAFLGFTMTAVVYVITILITGFGGSFLEWKYIELELVQSGNAA